MASATGRRIRGVSHETMAICIGNMGRRHFRFGLRCYWIPNLRNTLPTPWSIWVSQVDTEKTRAMTDQETIKKLEKQIKRLRKRLLEKQRYEREMLIQCGSTPAYIENIKRKDELALRED